MNIKKYVCLHFHIFIEANGKMIDTTWDLVHITVTFGFWERHLFPDRAPYRATEIVFHKSG